MSDSKSIEAAREYVKMESEIREMEIKHTKGNDPKWSELVAKQAQIGVRYAVDWAMDAIERNGK